MMHDVFGQQTSLETATTLEDWNAAQLGFLAHAAVTPRHLGAVLAAEPGFALGHAVKGMFLLLLGRSELVSDAHASLLAAETGVSQGSISAREKSFVEALRVWLAGRPSQAVGILETILDRHPGDTLAMKMSHAVRFVLGDTDGMRRSIERVLPSYAHDHAGRGYLLGCHAFALEETGAYDAAEIAGRQALWMAPDDAWGLHAVAHVHDMTADMRGGLDWLEARQAAWAHCNNFRYHVWWHMALMHLDLGQVDRVLHLYDSQIRSDRTDDYRDISNATSLLARLELEGIKVGDRWEELADIAARRTEDGSLIFADLHYLLALIGGDRTDASRRLLTRIHRDARSGCSEAQERMRVPGASAARGLQAFGEGRFAAAFQDLSAVSKNMHLAGGSHAQRDIFERMTIDAGIRAGQLDAAERFLDARRLQRAGREDSYAEARRDLIASARGGATAQSVSAQ